MKLMRIILILCFVFFGPGFVNDSNAQSKSKSMRAIERRANKKNRLLAPAESRKVRKSKKKIEDQKKEQRNQDEEAREAGIKKHVERQTPQTQERMKASLKKSEELRKRDRESFFKRVIKRKKKYYES